jgi:hypothetical protein
MDQARRELVVALELHEAEVWADCFEAAAALPGNPLGAVVQRSMSPPLHTLEALDSPEINRVVGLGTGMPASRDQLRAIIDFHRSRGRRHLRVELSPVAAPAELPAWLIDEGFTLDVESPTKIVRSTHDVGPTPADTPVRLLGLEHREAIAALNSRAWGDWSASSPVATWFGATVGAEGFRHYGILDGDRLMSVGVMAVKGELAWLGFGATDLHYRDRGLRAASLALRLAHARDLGCRVVHAEVQTRYSTSSKLPFEPFYERQLYSLTC